MVCYVRWYAVRCGAVGSWSCPRESECEKNQGARVCSADFVPWCSVQVPRCSDRAVRALGLGRQVEDVVVVVVVAKVVNA